MTFVRGTDGRLVLACLGVDPDDAIRPDSLEFSSTPGITIVRSGDWLVALETATWPRGIRPDVLRRLAVGTQPDRLRPLAEEFGMSQQDGSPSDSDYDLGDLEILLLIAETALGLSRNEADLGSPLLKVPDQPADPTPRPPASHAPPLVSSAQLRPHVQRLLDSGLAAEAVAAHLTPVHDKRNRQPAPRGELLDPGQDRRADTRHRGATQHVILSAQQCRDFVVRGDRGGRARAGARRPRAGAA
jgi:hypothetical protein